jgi:murein DD-endopeptidase MepM/ murein hydrolase activator NlpD
VIWKKLYIFLIVFSLGIGQTSYAQTATTSDLLKSKIEERNNQIKQLETEISQYNQEVNKAQGESKTLQSTIKSLDLNVKKINTDINLTQTKISKANLTIEDLSSQINTTEAHIDLNKEVIAGAIRNSQMLEQTGLLQLILSKRNISDVWNDIDNIRQIQETIRDKSKELVALKSDLESKQSSVKTQKNNLVGLKQDLSGKKQAVEQTVQEKATLLNQTKNKEQTYTSLVKQKEEQKAQFEKDLYDFESQLHILIDPNSYPVPKRGILAWPLDNVFITQLFGKTVGAEKLYVSGSHNGVDFRASIGTPVKVVLDGVVTGTGNTDIYPGCYSWGKWVLVRHDNGLSTIYGHLSVISVTVGQELSTGNVIGYSGNTGYTTGPHLHVTVYATQGLKIEKFVNSRGCKEAIIPLADTKAYLDPMIYFPAYNG